MPIYGIGLPHKDVTDGLNDYSDPMADRRTDYVPGL
jgi:hypothetical protein